MHNNLNIIYQNNDILVVEKPISMPSQKDKTNDLDLLTIVCNNFKNNDILIINRLDRPVGGIIIFAKNKIAATKITNSMLEKNIKKTYLVVVCGNSKEKDNLNDHLIKNQRLNVSKVVHKNTPNAKNAILNYKKICTIDSSTYGTLSLLKVELDTGRHHQIRVQLANAELPIWGDTKYNPAFKSTRTFVNIGLWSYALVFEDYSSNKIVNLEINPPNIEPFNFFEKIYKNEFKQFD